MLEKDETFLTNLEHQKEVCRVVYSRIEPREIEGIPINNIFFSRFMSSMRKMRRKAHKYKKHMLNVRYKVRG